MQVFRGRRDYIHSTDLMAAAPFTSDLVSFRFDFRQPIRVAGSWTQSSVAKPDAGLSISHPSGTVSYVFEPNPALGPCKPVAEINEAVIIARTHYE